jgi:Cu(I)/Ag(I) efflux system membrane fusion protein/cobalt-zinc-cadmium efflux system membrane fusion protein
MKTRHGNVWLILIGLILGVGLVFMGRLLWGPSEAGSEADKELALAQENGKDLSAGSIDPKTGKRIKYWVAPMDPTYIRDKPGKSPMGMDLVPVYEEEGEEKEPTSTIRIDPVTIQNMGVRLGTVERRPLTKTIRTVGFVTYDERSIYAVNTKFDGWIEKIHVNFEGESVRTGQPLFDIYSPELVTAQEEFLLARRQYLTARDSEYAMVRQGARRLYEASRKRLRYWDLTEKQIDRIENTGEVRKTVAVYSPASGVVTQKNAFAGHYVKAGEHQYEIADLSIVWVDVDVYEFELPWVREGMAAEMELAYVPGRRFEGKVLYIYPYLDTETRTAKLRLQFSNPNMSLKPGMYATVYLESKIADNALVVPQEAVIHSGTRDIVFVVLGQGRFQAREVQLGVEGSRDDYQVLRGVKEGEKIVISAQFLMDSESRLREAIQKMIEARTQAAPPVDQDELEMSGMTMESDELDMGGMTMEDDEPDRAGMTKDGEPTPDNR